MIPEKYHRYVMIYLAVVHLAGAIGLVYFPELFLPLTPLNLLMSALLVLGCAPFSYKLLFAFLFVALSGWSVEWLGVETGLVFGDYTYGEGLGIKVKDVPLTIGLNWGILVYVCSQWAIQMFKVKRRLIGAAVVATLMVTLDLLMEYAAPAVDFWTFDGGYAGLLNYIGWWIVSFILASLVYPAMTSTENRSAPIFYLIQIIFFAVLDLLLMLQ